MYTHTYISVVNVTKIIAQTFLKTVLNVNLQRYEKLELLKIIEWIQAMVRCHIPVI